MVDKKTLRNFGFLMAGVLFVIALLPLLKGKSPALWAAGVGVLFFLPGLIAPRILDLPYRWWMKLGHVLGYINTRIILGLIFFLLITPLGIFLRITGRSQVKRHFDKNASTYRVHSLKRDHKHMERQF
jgi:hypothetical protein